MKQEIRAYTAAMTRILTNRRPYWTRLRGDCGGREQHYYDKLLTMVPVDAEFAKYLEMVTAATKIQRCVRNFLRSIRIQKAGGVGALATRRPSKSRARTAEALKGMLATEGLVSGGNRELNSPSDGPAAAARRCTWQEVLFELEVRGAGRKSRGCVKEYRGSSGTNENTREGSRARRRGGSHWRGGRKKGRRTRAGTWGRAGCPAGASLPTFASLRPLATNSALTMARFLLQTLRNKMDAAAKHNEKPAPRPRRSSAMV